VTEPIVAALVETVAAVTELEPRATSLALIAEVFAPSATPPTLPTLER